MKCKKIILTVYILSIGLIELQAQESNVVSGGDAAGSGGSSSFSVGQATYTTNISMTGSVAQGVQQPYEISIVTEIEEAKEISLSFSVYPNPTTDFLKLNVGNYTIKDLNYQLYDVNGKIIESNKVNSNETSISMENTARGIYFLNITENNKELKTFKIIKN